MFLSIIIPTHNPNPARLIRTLEALRGQTLHPTQWELLVVDNASNGHPILEAEQLAWHPFGRVVREDILGLTAARLRGFSEARGDILVLVDDDNVLDPEYLNLVARHFASDASLGAVGGKSIPEFETMPPNWTREFDGLLALRDLGDQPLRAAWTPSTHREYPICAPIGAGMALSRAAADAYVAAVARDPRRLAYDRRGAKLISGGDNDLVMTILETGLSVAYEPELCLTHLIPSNRSQLKYLGALNRAIARSWVCVLALHQIRPWAPVHRFTVPLRQLRSWLRLKAWCGPAEWVRWQGSCGQFEGLAELNPTPL